MQENKYQQLEDLFFDQEQIKNKMRTLETLKRFRGDLVVIQADNELGMAIPDLLNEEILYLIHNFIKDELENIEFKIQTEINNLAIKTEIC